MYKDFQLAKIPILVTIFKDSETPWRKVRGVQTPCPVSWNLTWTLASRLLDLSAGKKKRRSAAFAMDQDGSGKQTAPPEGWTAESIADGESEPAESMYMMNDLGMLPEAWVCAWVPAVRSPHRHL